MKNVIKNLNNFYKPVKDAKRSRELFFSLADYVNYIKETPATNKIIKTVLKEKEIMLKERDEYEIKALQELAQSKKVLFKIIKENKISFEELKQALKELELYENGNIVSSGVKSDNIKRYLWEIAKILFQNGYKEALKEFIEEKPTTPNIYIGNKNFVFSSSLPKRQKLDGCIVELRKTKLWGCWDYINLVPIILLEKKEFPEVVSKRDLGIGSIFVELRGIFKARNCIQSEVNSLPPQTKPEEDREMQEYKLYASRIHNYLINNYFSKKWFLIGKFTKWYIAGLILAITTFFVWYFLGKRFK